MNKYRCETCTKPHSVPDGLSRHPHFFCCDEELPFEMPNVTAIRGCASHSSQQFEREKVLEELENQIDLCKQIDDNLQYYLWLEDVESIFYGFRQSNQEEQG